MFRKHNPTYIIGRMLRKTMPERLAHLLLSRRGISIKELYRGEMNSTYTYLGAFEEVPELKDIFRGAQAPVVLEAGTGIYNPASAPFLLSGARELILLEPYAGANIDDSRFRHRVNGLIELATRDPGYPLPKTDPPSEPLKRIRLCDRLWESTGLEPHSVDLILSASVLEHLREPEAVIKECSRIIKSGGWMVNIVDLRDHFFKYPFEMLKYSESGWNRLTTRKGGSGYQNRWRLSHWKQALSEAGFKTKGLPLLVLHDRLRAEKEHFHENFRHLPDEDLEVARAMLVSRKEIW